MSTHTPDVLLLATPPPLSPPPGLGGAFVFADIRSASINSRSASVIVSRFAASTSITTQDKQQHGNTNIQHGLACGSTSMTTSPTCKAALSRLASALYLVHFRQGQHVKTNQASNALTARQEITHLRCKLPCLISFRASESQDNQIRFLHWCR